MSANVKNSPTETLSYAERLVLTNPDSAFLLIQKLRKKYSDRKDVHALAVCNQQLGKIKAQSDYTYSALYTGATATLGLKMNLY